MIDIVAHFVTQQAGTIFLAHGATGLELTGQNPARHWHPHQNANAGFCSQREERFTHRRRHHTVFDLENIGQPLRDQPFTARHIVDGDAAIADLAGGFQLVHGFRPIKLLQIGHGGAVELIDVDAVALQTAQTGLSLGNDARRREILFVALLHPTDLAGDQNIAAVADSRAQKLLAASPAIGFCGIKEGDAQIHRLLHQIDPMCIRAMRFPQTVTAKANFRNGGIMPTQLTIVHLSRSIKLWLVSTSSTTGG